MPDVQQQCNFDRHNRRGDFQANPFRQNIRSIHRPSPSFWPAVIVDFFAIAHAKLRGAKRQTKVEKVDLMSRCGDVIKKDSGVKKKITLCDKIQYE
jgi:hypothetical protein